MAAYCLVLLGVRGRLILDLHWLLKETDVYVFTEWIVEVQEQTQQSPFKCTPQMRRLLPIPEKKKKASKQNTIVLPSAWHGLNKLHNHHSYLYPLFKKSVQPHLLPCDQNASYGEGMRPTRTPWPWSSELL